MRLERIFAGGGGCLLIAFAVGCTRPDAETEGPGVAVSDSAGVAIAAVDPLDEWQLDAWQLGTVPRVRIGSVDGDEGTQLYRVRGGTVLSDGRIAIINAGSQEIRFFSAAGEFERSIGGRGDGPTEHRALNHLSTIRGDSLVSYDARLGRVTAYDADGSVGRSLTLEPEANRRIPLGAFPNGDLLMWHGQAWSEETEPGPVRDDATYLRLESNAGTETNLAVLPSAQSIFHRHSGIFTQRRLTFARESFGAVTGRDSAVAVMGASDTYEFQVFDEGGLRRIVRVSHALKPVEDGRFDFIRDSVLGTSGGEDTREFWRTLYEAMPRLETYPAYLSLRGDTEGFVWVREEPGAGVTQELWTVFRQTGEPVARVELPYHLSVLEIGRDYILAVEEDELETEYVSIYPLNRVSE